MFGIFVILVRMRGTGRLLQNPDSGRAEHTVHRRGRWCRYGNRVPKN